MLIVTDFLYQALNQFEWEKKRQRRNEDFVFFSFYLFVVFDNFTSKINYFKLNNCLNRKVERYCSAK